ncbi:hypothetical protein [Burkholderia multivorans]|uniref:hypothetical protein n=1 Tax=Burkholderia multivorans TaxID=87883 RepID=UPI0011B20F66|nr:hypothetical protein [Burkholderia multivorans]MBY4791624.1 hypothetical protein [Burkholderia multivorans]
MDPLNHKKTHQTYTQIRSRSLGVWPRMLYLGGMARRKISIRRQFANLQTRAASKQPKSARKLLQQYSRRLIAHRKATEVRIRHDAIPDRRAPRHSIEPGCHRRHPEFEFDLPLVVRFQLVLQQQPAVRLEIRHVLVRLQLLTGLAELSGIDIQQV